MEAILDKDKQLSKDINYENYKEVLALTENGKPLDNKKWIVGINYFRYSEGIKHSPLKENMTPDDIFKISHKRADVFRYLPT